MFKNIYTEHVGIVYMAEINMHVMNSIIVYRLEYYTCHLYN